MSVKPLQVRHSSNRPTKRAWRVLRERNQFPDSAADLGFEIRIERDSADLSRLGPAHDEERSFHVSALSTNQFTPAKPSAERQPAREPVRLGKAAEHLRVFQREPVRRPLLDSRQQPLRERRPLNEASVLAPPEQTTC